MKRLATLLLSLFICLAGIAQTLTSSNLPIIIINTNGQEIVDDPKISADMGIIYNGEGAINAVTDPFNHYEGKIGIEIRGQSSQMFPMKSYGLELQDDAGESDDKSLFGLPKESDWVLYAPFNDKTLMHNFLAYTMAREMGHWAANCRYVELVINGDYRGIYVFMEKIKRNSGRVNIPKMSSSDITGDAVTGGYIFSIDKEADAWLSNYITPHSENGQHIQFAYVYPKIDAIVTEQKDYIKKYVDSFEISLVNSNFQDKVEGWRKFANEPSFIDYFIENEVSRNIDAYRLSTFFYKDRQSKGGKIVAGPVWDYDLAFRNADYCDGSNTNGWAYEFNSVCPQDYWQIPFWWERFLDDTAFMSNLKCRWMALRQTTLSEGHLYSLIDSIVNLTTEARERHFGKWQILGQYIWPNPRPIPTSYAEEISVLKSWLADRLSWIDENLPNTGACYEYPSNVSASVIVAINPNLIHSQVNISIKSRLTQSVNFQVVDAMGRRVYANSMQVLAGDNSLEIAAGRWQRGIYFVQYTAHSGEKGTIRLLKD